MKYRLVKGGLLVKGKLSIIGVIAHAVPTQVCKIL